jgi:hypothetical protein
MISSTIPFSSANSSLSALRAQPKAGQGLKQDSSLAEKGSHPGVSLTSESAGGSGLSASSNPSDNASAGFCLGGIGELLMCGCSIPILGVVALFNLGKIKRGVSTVANDLGKVASGTFDFVKRFATNLGNQLAPPAEYTDPE